MGYASIFATGLPYLDDAGSASAARKCPKALYQTHARDRRWCGDCTLTQENPLIYIDVYFRILHAYTIIYLK